MLLYVGRVSPLRYVLALISIFLSKPIHSPNPVVRDPGNNNQKMALS
jgi:hypothetical protein